MRVRAPKWALAIASAIAAFLLTIAVDRVASFVLRRSESLVFPPNSRFRLQTTEFEFEAQVNSLGFRGPQFGALPGKRVLAIGDSSTYGWGVQDWEAWPKVLERELRERGTAVEIANLGRPGAGPEQYARIAEVAIPALKPSWVVVGLLQGDDLNQSGPRRPDREPPKWPLLNALYPTLSEIKATSSAEKPTIITAAEARKDWQRRAATLLAQLKPDERRRFEALEADIRDQYRSGDLNPYAVALAVHEPRYFSWLLAESSGGVRTKVAAMADQLAYIREVARVHDARVLVVSIPNWPYISHPESTRRLGFDLQDEMLTTTAMDDEIREACREAGIQHFVSVTGEIRERAAAGAALYYPLDGHFTREGQRSFANALVPKVSRIVASAK